MIEKSKKIMVIAYKYPPYEGVGARRWAKFSKYLAKSGYEVHIITGNWKSDSGNSWRSDTVNKNVKVNRLPYLLSQKYKPGIIGKIYFRFEIIFSRIFHWTDEAYGFYAQNMWKIIRYIKKHNITTVIATGGPFSSNYFASQIKMRVPEIKLVQDFRDPWITDYFYANPLVQPNSIRYKKEVQMEKISLQYADVVISVTPGYIERFKQNCVKYNLIEKNLVLLENGFDEEDRLDYNNYQFPIHLYKRSVINIAHFGTVQFGREKSFYQFLLDCQEDLKYHSEKVCFHLFGSFEAKHKDLIKNSEFSSLVIFHDFVAPKEVQKFMYFADMHLVINDEIYYYAYGTKLYDALMYKKPIMLLSKEGDLYHLINKNKLGVVSNNSKEQNRALFEKLVENFDKIKNGELSNSDYNYSKHSIDQLTKQMILLLNP